MKNKLFLGAMTALCTAVLLAVFSGAVQAQTNSIPNVQQWTTANGSYTFSATSRIVINPAYFSQLNTTAYVLQKDISYLKGVTLPVITGSPAAGDIYLSMSSTNASIGTEGYTLSIASYITINAKTDAGTFYGTRTLLQYIKQSNTVAAGSIVDWPKYARRGLMVDVGDMYFSLQWLENHIRDLSYLKLNTLHLHLSDIWGFRLQSTSHPEINTGTSPLYTHADISTLVQLAQQYHINIVPEIDTPSHSTKIINAHPELQLKGPGGANPKPNMLDISLPGTYTLVSDLLNEFVPLFPGPDWHAGTDEYVTGGDFNGNTYPQLKTYAQSHWGASANGVDTYLNYVNWLDGILISKGKKTRAWEDPYEYTGSTISLNTTIALDLWAFVNPQTAINSGFYISNAGANPLYYNVGLTGMDASYQPIYETWAPNLQFGSESGNNWSVSAQNAKLQGAAYHIWANSATDTESNVATGIEKTLRAFAQKSWGSTKKVALATQFTPIVTTIGHAPGWGIATGAITIPPAYAGTPYGGTPIALPGKIECENYDLGGQNIAYSDTTTGNSGGVYRTDNVDLETCSDTGGGYDVGGSAAGEWLRFSVNATTTKTYTVRFRVANGGATGQLHLEDENGTNLTGAVNIPSMGGWQTWTNVTVSVPLSAGQHVLKLVEDTGGYNLNYIQFQ